MTLTSPYPDDQTRTKDIAKITEAFIQENWNASTTTVPLTDIKFGVWGDQILSNNAKITLRADTTFNNGTPIDIGSRRWEWKSYINIDLFVLNNKTNVAYDDRAMKMMKFLEDLFISTQNQSYKGIYSFTYRTSMAMPDPEQNNIDRRRISIIATYIADVT